MQVACPELTPSTTMLSPQVLQLARLWEVCDPKGLCTLHREGLTVPWEQMPSLPWWPRCLGAAEKGGSGSLEVVLGLSSTMHMEGLRGSS